MSNRDAYTILGVNKNASELEIKKAYRRLSLEYHPDRNGNSEESKQKFQEINEAYAIITHKDDVPEVSNDGNFHQDMGIDIASIFSFFAENKNSDFAQHMNMQMNKPVPIIKTIDITLEQAYAGCMIPVEIDRIFVENNIKTQERETLYVQVPKGTDSNELLIFRNIGNRAETGVSGDVKIFIKVLDHATFKRVGLDLIYNKQITLKESLCGVSFNIPHLSGKNYNINNTAGSSIIAPSFEKKIMGLGLSRDEHAGSLIIKFDIIFPTKLPIEIVHKLAELL